MNIRFHSSVLFVKNIEVSKKFYCQILSQKMEYDFGNNIGLKCGLSLWEVQENHKINKDFYTTSNKNGALELYFETENIQNIVDEIKQKKNSVYHDLIEESWGQKTIRFFDPDQNLIEIGEKLEVFIQRMHREGLDIKQINKKTGVPIDQIRNIIVQ